MINVLINVILILVALLLGLSAEERRARIVTIGLSIVSGIAMISSVALIAAPAFPEGSDGEISVIVWGFLGGLLLGWIPGYLVSPWVVVPRESGATFVLLGAAVILLLIVSTLFALVLLRLAGLPWGVPLAWFAYLIVMAIVAYLTQPF